MSRDPTPGTPGEPPEGKPDNRVVFDPTAWQPPKELARSRRSGRGRAVVTVLFAAFLGAGAYWLYDTREVLAPGRAVAPPPPPVVPTEDSLAVATLTSLGREDMSGPVGSSVELVVRAMSAADVPMADTVVQFHLTEGRGELSAEAVRTNARGIARSELSLPLDVQTVVVTAAVEGSELETRIPVRAHAGQPERIVATGGVGQETEVGDTLPDRVRIQVTDAAGNPVPGADIRFDVLSGGGDHAPSRTRTDSLGVASALWRLGMEAGTQQLSATAVDIGSSVTFSATARPRPAPVETDPGPVETGPVTVIRREYVIGGSYVCKLVGGVANCRGANDRSQRTERSSGLVSLTSGVSHVCGLSAVGEAVCWGANEGGQLGDGTRTDRPSPVEVRTQLRFSILAAGQSHTCGLAGGGVPICWGQNLNGQIGDGSRNDARAPRTVGGGLSFTSLIAGWNHTCGRSANGNAWCWGQNSDGQLGDGSRLDGLVPTLVRGANLESLTAGSAHTCGISGSDVLCWGANRFGQLGDGTTEGRAHPEPVIGLTGTPVALAAGAVHTCALLADGAAYCWGQNLRGQLGDGSTENRTEASPVAGDHRFQSIHAGGALTCGITGDGSEYCWGFNQRGQLGDGTRENRSIPTPVVR